MPGWIIDVVMLVMLLVVTWALYREGLWGAALIFANVMIGGLVAFNFYEPVANLIEKNLSFMASFADIVSLTVLFSVVFSILRFATDSLGPVMMRFPAWLDQLGRVVFSLLAAWYLCGMILCMMQTAPLHKQFLGYQWQEHALWSAGIDRYWLGYVQASTRDIFDWNPPRPFDPNSDFIKRYHDHRPLGDADPSLN